MNYGTMMTVAKIMFGIGIAALVSLLVGCAGWDKKSCAAIDLAHHACTTVKYIGEDGKEHAMQLERGDLDELGRVRAARAADAGAGK